MGYRSEGYEVVSGLDTSIIAELRSVLADAMRRIGPLIEGDDLSDLILRREAEDHSLVYQAALFVGSSAPAFRLVNAITPHVERASGIQNLHVMAPMISVQIPSDERFDYKWHQESAFYPWTRELVNVWVPLQPTTVETGTMFVAPGSHLAGQRETKSYYSHGTFLQLECDLQEREVPMELEVGQFVMFDGNMVHRSHINSGDKPRATAILRYIGADSIEKVRPLYKALSYED